jgi:chromosome segregation ATPase
MGKLENTESRMNAIIERLEEIASSPREMPQQGSLLSPANTQNTDELESLRSENQLLRQELLELTAAFNGLKQASETVAGRLDSTIHEVSTLLEQ